MIQKVKGFILAAASGMRLAQIMQAVSKSKEQSQDLGRLRIHLNNISNYEMCPSLVTTGLFLDHPPKKSAAPTSPAMPPSNVWFQVLKQLKYLATLP